MKIVRTFAILAAAALAWACSPQKPAAPAGDGAGVIRWKHVARLGLGDRGAQEIREKLLELFPAPAGGA